MTTRTTFQVLAVTALIALCCTACGNGGADAPRSVANSFEKALGSDDGATACNLLAPTTLSELEQSAGSPCAQAILDQDLPPASSPRQAVAYGSMAQVRFAEDTLFLSQYDGKWLVLAAGCTPGTSRFDCTIQGG
jgi:hypothetical protein